MRKIIVALLVAMLVLPGPVLAAKKIHNIENQPVPVKSDGSSFSLAEVQETIISGCKIRKWTPVLKDDGLILCSITVRGRHFAEVEIRFSAEHYSILYKSSNNLDYNEERQRIHRNYNNWVINLSNAIENLFRNQI